MSDWYWEIPTDGSWTTRGDGLDPETVLSVLDEVSDRYAGAVASLAEGRSPDCCHDLHGCCPSASCKCGCHAGQEYVPLRGWLPVAQAREDRRQYLDEDAAIERAHDHEGD